MDAADPQVQKAIYESLHRVPSGAEASGSGGIGRELKRTTSEGGFGRVDSLRRSGISPAASKCGNVPVTQIRFRRNASLSQQSAFSRQPSTLSRQQSGISRRGSLNLSRQASSRIERSATEPPPREDSELEEVVERDIVLQTKADALTFHDIAGLETAKKLLTEAITLPLLMPDFFTGIREPWKGVLLFGPPGSGKTLLARALASTESIQFFNCPSSTLTSKYRGDSEKLVRAVFMTARKSAPSIVFFDEADALISKRGTVDEHEASRRFKSEVLQQMDGVASDSNHVMVLATSNCPWDIDEAILRRFEKRIFIPLPDYDARKAALQLHLRGIKCAKDVDLEALAECTEGYSCADIRLICKDASMMFMRKWIGDKSPDEILKCKDKGHLNAVVTMEDFHKALDKSTPSVRGVDRYKRWAASNGCL